MSLVGENIDALCSRCGFTLAHIVLYEVGGTVRRVKCKTCGAEHRYHGPVPQKGRLAQTARGSGRSAGALLPKVVRPSDSRQWESLNASVTPDSIVWDYKWTERYEKGDVIAHPRFGRGFILSVTTGDMEVLFLEGRKRMAMNRPATGP